MTLKEIYEKERVKPTPIQDFIKEICKVTEKTEAAAYRWIGGKCAPDKLTQKILAKHFKTTPEELFRHIDKK